MLAMMPNICNGARLNAWRASVIAVSQTMHASKWLPNTAYTGHIRFAQCRLRGFVAVFEHFSGFEFSLFPDIVHTRPAASNANRLAV
jgi:hypothetical protein